jgi:hypothetical protein
MGESLQSHPGRELVSPDYHWTYSRICPNGMANRRLDNFTASFPLQASMAATQAGIARVNNRRRNLNFWRTKFLADDSFKRLY